MNYKEKYEKALERARNLHKDAIDMGDSLRTKMAEIIFPELTEKFKIGDWIVSRRGTARIIGIGVTDSEFLLEYTDGDQESLSIEYVNSTYTKWTIQKAWDGDVLAAEDKDKVFIYNGKLDLRGRVCAYCGIYKTYDGVRFTKCAIGNYFTYKEPHPATKEQRELLFAKMKEAGYEWDSQNNSLLKI